jgi:hypothetical protein
MAAPTAMRPLFVAGNQRSGTTALARYLNHHSQILICVERYKYVQPENITPDLFSFERILAVDPSETNVPEPVTWSCSSTRRRTA